MRIYFDLTTSITPREPKIQHALRGGRRATEEDCAIRYTQILRILGKIGRKETSQKIGDWPNASSIGLRPMGIVRSGGRMEKARQLRRGCCLEDV